MSEPRPPELPDERDAWLHQALRHAPDAAATPPSALREAILAAARAAARPRPRRAVGPSVLARASTFWSWLARPPVAAGFASVMVATLVGMLWWDRPVDETLRPAPTSSSGVVESTPASPPAPAAADAPVLPPPTTVLQTPAAVPPADAAPSKRTAAAPAKTAPAAIAAAKARKEEPTSILSRSAPAPSPFPDGGTSESSALAGSLHDERRQAAPALAKKAENETPSDAQASGNVTALAKPASPARERAAVARRDTADSVDALGAGAATAPQAFAAAPAARQAPPAPAAQAAPPAQAALRESAWAAAKASPRPMAPLLASIAQDATRWSQRAQGNPKPLATSTQAWLVAVDTATVGRWQTTADRDAPAESPAQAPAFAVLLDHAGQTGAIVRVDEAGVFFRQAAGASWFAPLPADEVARLRAALPR